ncbi:MAG: apolipoprotein N-acyltransferase [Rhodospirillaceae bacterium]|nr:apolipoprotein N-acyltransferase [Rhodospirillaceae bacterium]
MTARAEPGRAGPSSPPSLPSVPGTALARLGGWRRRGVAVLSGAAVAAALPPVDAAPLLFVAFPVLLLLIEGAARARNAFWIGWWFGFGFFVAGLYWLAWPLTLDLAAFGWMIPFAVFGISGGLAIFPAAVAALLRASGMRGLARILLLAIAWTVAEWLRGHVLSGFPWNLVATAWAAYPPMMQPASLVGAYGLGFVTVALAAAPVLLFEPEVARWRRGISVIAAALVLAGLWSWGAARLAGADPRPVDGVRLRLVQGNVPQTLKWAAGRREQTFTHYIDLTRGPGFDRITHAIWPETAIDYRLVTDYAVVRVEGERRARLASAVPPAGALILGAIRDSREHWYNSVHVVGPAGTALATYDKHHLVPFGEYVPLRGLLRRIGIEQIAHGAGDYSAGAGPATLPVPAAPPMSPIICYEAIFPHRIAGTPRPGWIVNVTNDAWFGLTSGPYQHFASARLRAVEEGLPLARAANTGITAVVDAYGRVVARMAIMTTGVLDSSLPRATIQPPFYARLGDRALMLLLVAALGIALALSMRQIAQRTTRGM